MKKKIKIIDIFCYISTGENEKIPKRVKWRDSIWEYDDRAQDYVHKESMLFEQNKFIRTKEFLNDEVEILDNIPSPDNYVPIEKQMKNDTFTGGKWYIDGKEIMSMEIDNEEDEFEDIEEIEIKDFYKCDDYQLIRENFKLVNNQINQLIKNQKKIIKRLNNE